MTPLVTTANHRISTPNRQSDLVSLSFKVPLNFRVRFKLHATQRGISMNELLRQAFDRVMQEQELPTARSEDS
jgi:hypothetical protein